MAIPSLDILEKNFYIRKTGFNQPIDVLKRVYWKARSGSIQNYLGDLERDWLRREIGIAGGTPQGKFTSDLWKQLVSSLGYGATPFLDTNKKVFYLKFP